MKKPVVILAAAMGLVSAAAMATAQEPYVPYASKSFDRVDKDKNGEVSADELKSAAERRFLRIDTDKNGEVSAAEIDASLQKIVEQRRNRVLKAMDADGNGSISNAEVGQFVDDLIKEADADGNGGVTLDEARKLRLAKQKKQATQEGAN